MACESICCENMAALVDTLPFAAYVRDVTTQQYVLANDYHAQHQGFQQADELMRLTAAELGHHRRQRLAQLQGCLTLEATYQALIEQANQQVTHTKQPRSLKVCTLLPTGFIYIGILHKVPLVDTQQQVKAIFSFSQEVTAHTDLVNLYIYIKNITRLNKPSDSF